MHIVTEFSLWFVPLCLVAGIGAAYVLYAHDTKLKDSPRTVKILLFSLRATIISLLLFLLLGPYIERNSKEIKKPVIVLLQDNSASITLQKDSTYYKNQYVQDFQNFAERLRSDFDVDIYRIGDGFYKDSIVNFTDKQTNLSQSFQEISSRYYNRNLGAVVLATDGIYNVGENPVYSAQNMSITPPIYCIALGDSVQSRDNLISNVLHNEIVFRNNPFVVRLEIESHMLQGKWSKIELFDGKKKIYETTVLSKVKNFYSNIDCKIVSQEVGQKIYTVKIQSYDGEISYKNNSYVFSVDVLESRQKVLLIYNAVHPDVAAIRRSVESNSNFTITVSSVKEFEGQVQDYNCIILHGFPQSYGASKELLQKINSFNIPTIYIYNATTQLSLLDIMGVGVEISNRNNSTDEVQARFNKEFSLFDVDEETKAFIESAPPLLVPYGNYATQIQTQIVCWQNIGGIETNKPLIVCNELQGVKRSFICGEGLWRWRMFDYKKNATFAHFDMFINKLIGYVALTQKRSLFTVQSKHIFSDNQEVEFRAELYHKNYDPANDKEISLEIKDKKGKAYPYVFMQNGDFYKLQAGKFPPGEYTYKAKVEMDNKELIEKGVFYVIPLQIEYSQTQANHSMLQTISNNSGGALYYKTQFDSLYNAIKNNENIVPVSHVTQKRTGLLDSMLLLILLIVFAGTEWFFRKFYGSY